MQSKAVLCVAVALAVALAAGFGNGQAIWDEVKPGHYSIKEFHFHVYWLQNNPDHNRTAYEFRDLVVAGVAAGNFTVVCDGITTDILPEINEDNIPETHPFPYGPHTAGNYEIWVPREYYAEFLSFAIMNRGPLTIFIHPLGKISLVDHTTNAQFLGQPFPVDTSILSDTAGDPPQYPELGLGYAAASASH